ncbi:MAG TPA: amidohydrolase family protein [bacterium]|nr:amidohydrolase family protein [bacterium]
MSDETLFIDSHVHVLPPQRMRKLVLWLLKAWPQHPVSELITKEEIVAELRGRGVTHFFNLAYPLKPEETGPLNDFNLEFCRATPGAIPFAGLHPDSPQKPALAARALDAGFVGFKFHPFVQRFDPWDPRMDPLYAFMEHAGRPVILHTGFGEFYNLSMPVAALEKMLRRWPRLPFVFVHMAFPDLAWAFRMLDEFPALFLDATNVLALLRPVFKVMLGSGPDGKKTADVLLSGLTAHPGRVMHGSDHPVGMGALSEIYSDLASLPVDQRTRQSLRSGAAKSFIERFMPNFDWSIAL